MEEWNYEYQESNSFERRLYELRILSGINTDQEDVLSFDAHSEILRNTLFLGNEDSGQNLETRLNIDAIVSLGLVQYNQFEGIEYLHIHIDDNVQADLYAHFEKATSFIHKHVLQNHRVLVHCVAGVSRSPAIVMAYLMRFHKMTLVQSYMACLCQRPIVCPNEGFIRQLMRYEKELKSLRLL